MLFHLKVENHSNKDDRAWTILLAGVCEDGKLLILYLRNINPKGFTCSNYYKWTVLDLTIHLPTLYIAYCP